MKTLQGVKKSCLKIQERLQQKKKKRSKQHLTAIRGKASLRGRWNRKKDSKQKRTVKSLAETGNRHAGALLEVTILNHNEKIYMGKRSRTSTPHRESPMRRRSQTS